MAQVFLSNAGRHPIDQRGINSFSILHGLVIDYLTVDALSKGWT